MFDNVIEFDRLTRTAQEASEALGCDIRQIAKSIVFKLEDDTPILVIARGGIRVEETAIEKLVGQKLLKADADYCREKTGFVIGGIPPYGHKVKIKTFIDEGLSEYETIYAAAGKPNAVFKTSFSTLMSKAEANSFSSSK